MRRFFISLVLIPILLSCRKDGQIQIPQPSGFKELIEAYSVTQYYSQLIHDNTATRIIFEDGEEITFLASQVTVDDCIVTSPKMVAWNADDQWMVDGKLTGVYRDTGRENAEAFPVYIYFDSHHLYLYLSNGNHLRFDRRDIGTIGELPVIYLTTKNSAPIVSKEEYVTGTIKIVNPDLKFWDTEYFEAPMKIRGRGNSTWTMPKKPWKIKLEEKARLFDFSNDKEWCLLANYCDKSLLRNDVAMHLSRIIGFKWTPGLVPVEVYLNGDYQGVYSFCEHKKVSKERVNIDIDGGDILFELEENQDEKVCWWTDHGAPV